MFFNKLKRQKLPEEIIFNDPPNLDKMNLNTKNIITVLGKCQDVKIRELLINAENKIPVSITFIEGLIDHLLISDYILKPLSEGQQFKGVKNEKDAIKSIQQGAIYYSNQKIRNNINDVMSDILNGSAALIFDKEKIAVTFHVLDFEKRNISEPKSENVIKGSKDAFVETLRVNTSTVRRRIRTPNLVFEEIVVGKQSRTPICIVYVDGIVNHNIVDKVRKRLGTIDIDTVVSTGVIEESIIDKKIELFPQVFSTERPDIFCSDITDGRVGILIDGLPTSLIVPVNLASFLQASEDYSQNYIVSSLIRMLRYILVFITLLFPAFYISVTYYHLALIPTELILSIAASKKDVPFPIFFEVLIMLIGFEILIEAGARLPKTIGQAISIVGAVVVGQSAVEAKFVSPGVVIVIAISVIASFAMPNQDLSNALRVWRFILAILSSISGLFGIAIGMILLLFNLSKINSFGVSYLEPIVSSDKIQLEDTFIRLPNKFLNKRPFFLKSSNKIKRK